MSHKILPLHISELKYQDRQNCLLNGINLDLIAGPLTMIIGPNGAGKSLLLRLCHGLLRPTSGHILWKGELAKKPRRHQAFVFQYPKVLNRTVFQNIEYPLKLRNIRKKQRESLVVDALESTGIAHLALRRAVDLSGGEKQKLALARAWVTQPEVLFLDEPTASLDPKATFEVEGVIETIHHSGTKVIMVSHDLPQVRRLAGEVVFMHKGQVVESGVSDKILYEPEQMETRAFLDGELLI